MSKRSKMNFVTNPKSAWSIHNSIRTIRIKPFQVTINIDGQAFTSQADVVEHINLYVTPVIPKLHAEHYSNNSYACFCVKSPLPDIALFKIGVIP